MRRLITVLFLACLVSAPLSAQSITTTVCPGVGCVTFNVANQGSIGIQITGTWAGTITFQGSINNSTYVSLRVIDAADTAATGITTTTANGIFNSTIAGFSQIRVVFTAFSSGTAVVSTRVTQQAGKFGGGGSSGGGITGTLANTQIVFGTGVSSVSSNSNFTYDTTGADTFTALANAVRFGDYNYVVNGTNIDLDDSLKTITLSANDNNTVKSFLALSDANVTLAGVAPGVDARLVITNATGDALLGSTSGTLPKIELLQSTNSIDLTAPTGTINLLTNTVVASGKTLQATYKSNDGTSGLTATCIAAVTALTIKNGLITAVTCP